MLTVYSVKFRLVKQSFFDKRAGSNYRFLQLLIIFFVFIIYLHVFLALFV